MTPTTETMPEQTSHSGDCKMHETTPSVNPVTQKTPISTPREKLAIRIEQIAASHGVHPHRIFGDGVPGRTTPAVFAARREAIIAVIDDRPWWSYAQVAKYLNLTDDTIYKHARDAGHRRTNLYSSHRLRPKGGAQ